MSRYIVFWMLAFLGLFASAAVFGLFQWMTRHIDDAANVRAQELVSLSLAETVETLRFGVEDYAYWDLAYELVRDADEEGIYDNLGSGAAESDLFDQLFILGSNGQLLHAFDEASGDAAHSRYEPTAFEAIWAELQKHAALDHMSVSGVVENAGEYFLVVATWITPDDAAAIPNDSFSALFGLRALDKGWLDALENRTGIIGSFGDVDQDLTNVDAIVLHDASGAPVAVAQWQAPTPGSDLWRDMIASIVFICAVMMLICALAARFFQDQHKLLVRATRVAGTDHLTDLNNRAGLEDQLRTPRIVSALARGDVAVVYFDLNEFKSLNDEFGHLSGDLALKVTADRLRKAARSNDVLARLGGDEFVCLVVDRSPEQVAIKMADRMIDLSKTPIRFSDHKRVVMPAVGIAVASAEMTWETLLSQSDAAMYWSKARRIEKPTLFGDVMAGVAVSA